MVWKAGAVLSKSILEWFDASNPEHLRAFACLRHTGQWPDGFLPGTVHCPSGWYGRLLTVAGEDGHLPPDVREWAAELVRLREAVAGMNTGRHHFVLVPVGTRFAVRGRHEDGPVCGEHLLPPGADDAQVTVACRASLLGGGVLPPGAASTMPPGMDLSRRELSGTAVQNVHAFFDRFGGGEDEP